MSSVRIATQADRVLLKYIDHLAKQNRNAVGFLPATAYEYLLERGRIHILEENGEPAGYVARGPFKPKLTIYQVVVTEELRRIEHGTKLITSIREAAQQTRTRKFSCHCAADLAANSFWQTLGFEKKGRRIKSRRRKRWQNRYELHIRPTLARDTAVPANIVPARHTKLANLLLTNGVDLAALARGRRGRGEEETAA